MKTPVWQNLTHRGTVLAEGFRLSARILDESEMRRRVLALWQPAMRVFRHGADLILLFPEPRRVDCRRAAGTPLVRCGEILASFPLRQNEADFFQTAGETLVFLREGRPETVPLAGLQTESPENWLDTAGFEIVETETLGESFAKPVIVEKTAALDLREELAEVPPATGELAEILQTLRQKKAEFAGSQNQPMFSGTSAGGAFGKGFGGIFDAVKNLFSAKNRQSRQFFDHQPKPPGALRRAFTKMLFQAKIAPLVGRKQAQYLAKMMEMFENGDLDAALKHAVPLEDMQSLKQMSDGLPFLGFLRPRSDLRINFGQSRASGSSLLLADDWFNDLRQLYRQSFERLAAQNRIEEAAFVLAELLQSSSEAVEFLEKHGRFRLAAQLAESRDLPKDVIVRQWFLAGERRRAVQLAILHNCFEFVVARLEQQNHPQAAELREIWAESLAAGGNYAAAVNTLWRLEDRRATALEWIERVIEFGGAPAAEMLAKKLALLPERFDDVKAKLLAMIAETDADAAEARAAFAREAVRLAPNQALRTLVRPLARKILADLARGDRRFSPKEFHALVEYSGDYTLRADLPKLPVAAESTETFRLAIAAADRGASAVADALLLPDGKIAVALGEAGVKILSKSGKQIAHFDQPAHRFVVSDFGTKALALAPRGGNFRLAKIDFLARRAEYWCEAEFSAFANGFDGHLWFVATNYAEVFAIDTSAAQFEAVWKVPEIGGTVYKISRARAKLTLLVNIGGKSFEKWSYDLPQFTLRSRNQTAAWYQTANENQFLSELACSVAYSVGVKQEFYDEEKLKFEVEVYDCETPVARFLLPLETTGFHAPEIVENKYVLTRQTADAAVVSLYSVPKNELAEIHLSGAQFPSVRLDEKLLTVTDELGRVVVFDHGENILRKNTRV